MLTRAIAALALLHGGVAAAQVPASVSGVLVSRDNRLPVEGVRVAVLGTAIFAATDSAGRFDLPGIPAGVRVLQARAIGFTVASWLLDLSEGQSFRDTFDIEPRIVAVAAVTVVADPTDWRSEAAFERRKARGGGVFLSRDDIRQRRPTNLADLVRGVPGVMTQCAARSCTIRMARSTRQCTPEYFLDGYPATFATGANFPISVAAIRGIEVYRNQFEVPAEFQKTNLLCGVIAIWTIDPGERFDDR